MKVRRIERGWAGHFICASQCFFRRNTLLTNGTRSIVVSTVGQMPDPLNEGKWFEIGFERFYETMAFEGMPCECGCGLTLANVERVVDFESEWAIDQCDEHTNQQADAMHEAVVEELGIRLARGEERS